MSLIAEFMPRFALRQVDRVAVAASGDEAYRVVRGIDLQHLVFVRALIGLRLLPERVVAAIRRRPDRPLTSLRIEDITRPGSGFVLLGEQSGREVVVGSVGKFWQPSIDFVEVTPESFAAFSREGFGKLAWCLRVEPRAGGGAWISVELRVGATDDVSLARFKRYWRLIGPFSQAIRRGVLHKVLRQLGKAEEELRPVPGDGILPGSRFQKTHAAIIDSPPRRVWPWLVQMGCRRAGWYSFDFLDNGGVRSAERIIAPLQRLAVGDILPARPTGGDGFEVLELEPSRTLVLGTPSSVSGATDPAHPPWRTTWAFLLEPIGDDATQLTVRARADYQPGVRMALTRSVLAGVHELMERRQLHNLRRRAEVPHP